MTADAMTEVFSKYRIGAVIPAMNEAGGLARVLPAMPSWVNPVIVVDHGSSDGTSAVAERFGATAIAEPRPGYGTACLTGIAALAHHDIIVFLDADGSDDPGEMDTLIRPIVEGRADFVLGSRTMGQRERGSLTLQQIFGNRLACFLIRLIWGVRFTDLGPFRAIRRDALERLDMADRNYGWTVEMQVRAAKVGLRCLEVPATYRRRIGHSKVSGTVRGTIKAGYKILYVIAREALNPGRRRKITAV